MGTFLNPKIVTDRLEFYYDMDNIKKSWKGKPTTNLVTDTPTMNGWVGSYTLIDSSTKTFNIETRQFDITQATSAWRTWYWSVSSYIGQTVTISGDVEFVSETNATFQHITIGQGNTGPFPYHIAGSPAADRVQVATKPIEKISMSWTGVINSTGVVGFTQWINNVTVNGGNAVLQISNVQIEVNNFATPFVNGSRTATTSLSDITGRSTITISSLTYENDNTFRFVQSNNDLINTDIPVTDYPARTNFSYEVWYKPDAWARTVAANQYNETRTIGILIGASYYAGSAIYYIGGTTGQTLQIFGFLRANDAYRNTALYSIPTLNQYYHLVFVNDSDSGTMKLYVNGEIYSSVTGPTADYNSSNIAIAGNIGIGKRQVDGGGTLNYECFPGYLPLAKIYRKALSSDEVLQNYNATKERFQ